MSTPGPRCRATHGPRRPPPCVRDLPAPAGCRSTLAMRPTSPGPSPARVGPATPRGPAPRRATAPVSRSVPSSSRTSPTSCTRVSRRRPATRQSRRSPRGARSSVAVARCRGAPPSFARRLRRAGDHGDGLCLGGVPRRFDDRDAGARGRRGHAGAPRLRGPEPGRRGPGRDPKHAHVVHCRRSSTSRQPTRSVHSSSSHTGTTATPASSPSCSVLGRRRVRGPRRRGSPSPPPARPTVRSLVPATSRSSRPT